MKMEAGFPGGVAVTASFKGFTVSTDQPKDAGGGESAPSPFELLLASLATCAGFFALRFCQSRKLPVGFPEKYRDAILKAVDQCAVKRAMQDPPAFEVSAV